MPVSPEAIQHIDDLWAELAGQMPVIEAISFHPMTPDFPATWALGIDSGDVIMVDALSDPDRLSFTLDLGEMPAGHRLSTCENMLKVNAWLATQIEVVGGIALCGSRIVLKGLLRADRIDLVQLRQTVLDLQGAVHAWHYFRQLPCATASMASPVCSAPPASESRSPQAALLTPDLWA